MKLQRLFLMAQIGLLAAVSLGWLSHWMPVQADEPPPFVWPISGSSTPDLPQSSAYGPRLKASDNFRYDYHQGIDIPTPLSTTVLAITTGTVRIAGSHPAYSDGVVQIDHGNGLYSNYLHITQSLVVTNQVVSPGTPIALSGASTGGFPHLHFEIRDGSLLRRDAINPWRYLPYHDTVSHTVAISAVMVPSATIWVRLTTPATQLDVNGVALTVTSLISHGVVMTGVLDYEVRNLAYLGNPADLDEPLLDNIIIAPHVYTTSSNMYRMDVGFLGIPSLSAVSFTACAFDIKLNQVCQSKGAFQYTLVPDL